MDQFGGRRHKTGTIGRLLWRRPRLIKAVVPDKKKKLKHLACVWKQWINVRRKSKIVLKHDAMKLHRIEAGDLLSVPVALHSTEMPWYLFARRLGGPVMKMESPASDVNRTSRIQLAVSHFTGWSPPPTNSYNSGSDLSETVVTVHDYSAENLIIGCTRFRTNFQHFLLYCFPVIE
jgi:hypothetical protein